MKSGKRGWMLCLDGLWHYIGLDDAMICDRKKIAVNFTATQPPDVMTPGEPNCKKCELLVIDAIKRSGKV